MARQGHPVSHSKVGQLLHGLDYSLQSNRKTEEGQDHPDRDAQFRHIAVAVKRCLAKGSPVISVDTKKKELIGNYANAGQQWRPAKQPTPVQGHDFPPDVPPSPYEPNTRRSSTSEPTTTRARLPWPPFPVSAFRISDDRNTGVCQRRNARRNGPAERTKTRALLVLSSPWPAPPESHLGAAKPRTRDFPKPPTPTKRISSSPTVPWRMELHPNLSSDSSANLFI